MDKAKAAADIITHALPMVPFDGWTQPVLNRAAQAAGYKRTDAIRVFPGGVTQALDCYFTLADAHMATALSRYSLDTMKVRERIATAVRVWLECQLPHKEALRRALALQALPLNQPHGIKQLYHTVDEIWHAAGDTSTDFNFYTKRLLLAGVFSATRRYWLDDTSPGNAASWEFLSRRIEDVMTIEKAKSRLRNWLESALSGARG